MASVADHPARVVVVGAAQAGPVTGTCGLRTERCSWSGGGRNDEQKLSVGVPPPSLCANTFCDI